MAEQAAIAQDLIDLADALNLGRFAVSGYDWGGRAAAIAAALHPDRVRAAVLIGGDTIQNTISPGPPGDPEAERDALVSMVFQHRARAHCSAGQPAWHLSPIVADLVAYLAFQ